MGALAILCCPRHRMPTGTAGSHLLSVFEPRPLSLAASRADALRIAARERGHDARGTALKMQHSAGRWGQAADRRMPGFPAMRCVR